MQNLGILVIDMQENFFTEDKERLVRAQTKLLAWIKKRQIPIFTLEYDGKGETIPQLREMLKKRQSYFIKKYNVNGFEDNPELTFLLERWGIKNLVLTGIYHYACIKETAEGAKDNGIKVFTSEDLMDRTYDSYTRWYQEHTDYSSTLKELIRKIANQNL
jgi:nicotinamidase-related amidase